MGRSAATPGGVAVTTIYRCPARVTVRCGGDQCDTRTRKGVRVCAGCASTATPFVGVHAVVPWRGDSRYTLDQAVSTHTSRAVADHRAEAAGEQYGTRFVVTEGAAA